MVRLIGSITNRVLRQKCVSTINLTKGDQINRFQQFSRSLTMSASMNSPPSGLLFSGKLNHIAIARPELKRSSDRDFFGAIIKRNYGGKQPFSLKTVQDRVMLVCQLFDKINADKLTLDSHFINDLGLDSLDHVEVMLYIEKEFTMEIPDGDAEQLMTPRHIIQYICDLEDVFE